MAPLSHRRFFNEGELSERGEDEQSEEIGRC